MGQLDYKYPSRLYQAEDKLWYFKARNSQQARNSQTVGPFHDIDEAERALRRHVSDCKVRSSLAVSMTWPRRWNFMRLARRTQPKHAKDASFVAS